MLVGAFGQLSIAGGAIAYIEVCDFVVTEAIDMVVIKPHLACGKEKIFTELLGEVASRAEVEDVHTLGEGAYNLRRTVDLCEVLIDTVVRESRIYVFVHHVQDNGDAAGMCGIHQPRQGFVTTEVG